MDPRLESVGFPKVWDPAPGQHEGVLQRVLGETVIAQDPLRDRVELIADLVHQDGERLTVSAAGLLDEISIHLDLRGGPRVVRLALYDGVPCRKRSARCRGPRGCVLSDRRPGFAAPGG